MMWHPIMYCCILSFISQQCSGQLNTTTADGNSVMERTETMWSPKFSNISSTTTTINFVARRNKTNENVTKSNRETTTNRTKEETKHYSKSNGDILTKSSITNTYVSSLNANTNLTVTYNNSEELIQLSMDKICNNNTKNATTEALRNQTWVQQALRNESQAQQEESLRNEILAQEEILRNQTRLQKEEELRNQTQVQDQTQVQEEEILRNQTRIQEEEVLRNQTRAQEEEVLRNQTRAQEEEVLRNQTRVQEEEILRNQTWVQGKMLKSQTLSQEENVLRNQSWAEQEEQKKSEVKMYYFKILSQMWQYISQKKVLGNQTQAQQEEEQKKKAMIMHYLKNMEWVWQYISHDKALRNQTREQKEETIRNETWVQEELEKEEKRMYYFKISERMWKYISPVIIVLGTVGNILSISVMLRKQFRHTTMSFHLIALAIADTLVLYCALLPKFLYAYLSTSLELHSKFLCKMKYFLGIYVTHVASWIVVCLTSERFVAVIFPHYYRMLFTKARAAIALAFIILILLTFDQHYFWTYHLQEYTLEYIDPLTNTTKTHTIRVCWVIIKEHYDFTTNIWPWMDMALFSLLPLTFIIIGNVSICIKLGLAYCNRRNLGSSTNQSQHQTHLISTTIVLGSVSLIFVVSTLPVTIWQLHVSQTTYNKDARAKMQITGTTVQLLQYLNNAFNFVLYCLTGTQFRKEVIIMLTEIRNRIRGPQNNGDTMQI